MSDKTLCFLSYVNKCFFPGYLQVGEAFKSIYFPIHLDFQFRNLDIRHSQSYLGPYLLDSIIFLLQFHQTSFIVFVLVFYEV